MKSVDCHGNGNFQLIHGKLLPDTVSVRKKMIREIDISLFKEELFLYSSALEGI